mgnify:CR=1 FL=1
MRIRKKRTKRKPTAAMLVLAAAIMANLGAPDLLHANDVELTGMFRSYTGIRPSEGDVPLTEQTADIKLKGWGDMTQVNINPYAYVLSLIHISEPTRPY